MLHFFMLIFAQWFVFLGGRGGGFQYIHDGEVCYIPSEVTRNVTSENRYKWVTCKLHVPPPDFA